MKNAALFILLVCAQLQCVEPKHCTDPAYPYWCPKAEACCSYPYHDGKNSCYSSLSACTASGGSCETCSFSGTGGSYYYANWTCNGSSQCAAVMGASGGTAGPFCDQAACSAWGKKYIPGGYTCSTTGKFAPSSGTAPNGRCFQIGDF
jgi:hypothetical protein